MPTAGVIFRDPDTVQMLSNVDGTRHIARAWSNWSNRWPGGRTRKTGIPEKPPH
ncbi:hypothetical protein ACLQ28_13385 [Micromonospora sp. DT201]|uniref:hypothetical protein n=1 Tax=Micromonospora sp. DT201 TaxID=3393442 RepID=UPI003CF4CB1A